VNALTRRIHADLESLAVESLLRRPRVLASAQSHRPAVRADADGIYEDRLAFASNDYLGLAACPELAAAFTRGLQQYGVGAGASPAAGGLFAPHRECEALAAEHVGMAKALLFESGYMANLAILSALAKRGDTLYCDRLNHACLNDGAILARCRWHRYRHADTDHLASLLAQHSHGIPFIVTDAVFSMDGDIAPLAELLLLAERHDGILVVDDAHGYGVHGPHGSGTLGLMQLQSTRIVYMATLGKAVGVAGAFVAGHADVIEWLAQTARPYRYATAMPPAQAVALTHALQRVIAADLKREQLRKRIAQAQSRLTQLTSAHRLRPAQPSPTAIQPAVIGSNVAALAVAEALDQRGIWVPAIRPPTVPLGTARLRISLSANHSDADVDRLFDAITECLPANEAA
jgi:8-amino-7-oxononanoate synthase